MSQVILSILQELQPAYDFTQPVNFVEQGYLDSFDIVTLIGDIEERFSILIPAEDFLPENFSSLDAIAAMVRRCERMQKGDAV